LCPAQRFVFSEDVQHEDLYFGGVV